MGIRVTDTLIQKLELLGQGQIEQVEIKLEGNSEASEDKLAALYLQMLIELERPELLH